MLASLDRSVLLVVDVQPNFLAAIHEADRVVDRTHFLIKVATLLGVPVFATEQYPDRMGHTHEALMPDLNPAHIAGKMVFSAFPLLESWRTPEKDQVVLCGIETPICVNQTAHEAREKGLSVFVAEDAVGGRSELMHRNGLERMQAVGCEIAHSDSIVYEWMKTADHARFRDVLKIVKEHA